MKVTLIPLVILTIAYSGRGQWLQTNGPYADNITAIHLASTVSFAGSYQNGIYRSFDGGLNWSVTTYSFGSTITSFAEISDTIFAGLNGEDVYRSVDGGGNWIRMANGWFTNEHVRALAVHQGKLFAGTYGHGLFVCEDRLNFHPTGSALPNLYVLSLLSVDSVLIAGTNGGGICRSSNAGNSWVPSNTGLSDSTATCFVRNGTYCLAGTRTGVFRSTDKGATWSGASNGLRGGQIRTLCVHGGQLFAATNDSGIYRSPDNGGSWFPAGLDGRKIAAMASSGGSLFAGDGFALGGMFCTTDNGQTWGTRNNRIHAADVVSMVRHHGSLFAGTDCAGVFRSTNGGSEWQPVGLSSYLVHSLASNGEFLFAGTSAGVLRSVNEGDTWTSVNQGLSPLEIYSLAAGDSILFAGTGNMDNYVYRSTSNGDSWTRVLTGGSAGPFQSLCVSEGAVCAGQNYGFYRSTDCGNSWQQILSIGSIIPLALADVNGTVYVGTESAGVFRSTDNGSTWAQGDTGLTWRTVRALTGRGSYVYAGTFGGLFRSSDRGSHWTSAGLPNLIYSLLIADSILYAGRHGDGVWARHFEELTSGADDAARILTTFILMQNYPNPFNPRTHVSYQLPMQSHVTLMVYDLLGREVATLVNDVKLPGTYTAQWNAVNVASGVYYYRLTAGGFVQTKKLILMK